MAKHNPNPFDFVPFQSHPWLFSPQQLDAMGEQFSGYLEVQLKALTPLHIVGALRSSTSNTSQFYLEDDMPCIPASTIRGCLRSFMEALTNGWLSQATAEYPKKYKERHLGYKTFEPIQIRRKGKKGKNVISAIPSAVAPAFQPSSLNDGRIDIASYLFGIVTEAGGQATDGDDVLTRKGKLFLEDAFMDKSSLVTNQYWLPDIDSDAFMGGGKPSRSNWWYFQPARIQKRKPNIAEFVGDSYWGRKFYYHQDPNRCTTYYDKYQGNWRYDNKRDFQKVFLECVETSEVSHPFRIYVDAVPRSLLQLLVMSLFPGKTIRHKLGYGKAYGYGSIEFTLVGARLRSNNQSSRIPNALADYSAQIKDWSNPTWSTTELEQAQIREFIDLSALSHLAQICGWPAYEQLCFTYPPFIDAHGDKSAQFQNAIRYSQLEDNLPNGILLADSITVDDTIARTIAASLFNRVKKPIHFRYYQEQADGWDLIVSRRP